MIESFHTNMKGTVQFNGSSSRPSDIRSGVKQGCFLAPTLFGIFFALLLRRAFGTAPEEICLRTRSDGRLINLGRLRAETKVPGAFIRDMLFTDDAAVTTQSDGRLINLGRLRAKTKVPGALIRDMLFTDDAAVTTHT